MMYVCMQERKLDIYQAYQIIDTVVEELKKYRENVDVTC